MKIRQITNACCLYEAEDYRLLCDPWLTEGAFEGSWGHEPPILSTAQNFQDINAVYISHIHPDHFDPETLKEIPKNIPVIIYKDSKVPVLSKKLQDLGFKDIVVMTDKQTKKFGPFNLTMYGPFCEHPFEESILGNFIDSAIVINYKNYLVFNANDNMPRSEDAYMLHDRHGDFTVVQLKDSLAGAYPSCFSNLTAVEKESEAQRLLDRQFERVVTIALNMQATYVQPFAGSFKLIGSLGYKNSYLGVARQSDTVKKLNGKGISALNLIENETFDLDSKSCYWEPIKEFPKNEQSSAYAYEFDENPNELVLATGVVKAFARLKQKQEQLNYYPDLMLTVNGWPLYLGKNKSDKTRRIECKMDERLLARILERRSHWNNSEVGCHIEFNRVPNIYDPDFVNFMSFFHA